MLFMGGKELAKIAKKAFPNGHNYRDAKIISTMNIGERCIVGVSAEVTEIINSTYTDGMIWKHFQQKVNARITIANNEVVKQIQTIVNKG